MPTDRKSLERKGRHQPTGALLEQAGASIRQMRDHSLLLAEHGFTQEKQDELAALTNGLILKTGSQSESMGGSRHATEEEASARKVALDLIRTVALVAPVVMRDKGLKDATLSAFRARQRLRSTSAIVAWLVELHPLLARHDDDFKPYFAGRSPTALLDETRTALDHANTIQEVRRASIPLATFELNLAKGRVLELLEELNLVARIAFKDDRLLCAAFSKEILKRGHRHRRPKAAPEPSGEGESGKSDEPVDGSPSPGGSSQRE
jgi:hypothetical protein